MQIASSACPFALIVGALITLGQPSTAPGEQGNDANSWPEYRGPGHDGKSAATGLPSQWSETTNVVWKTRIYGRAWSSPVVLGDQVWVTTATTDGKEMFTVCVDRATGEIVHHKKVFQNDRPRTLSNNVNTYATPSPVIEEGRVYVHFGSYGTACLDTSTGKILWQQRSLPCDHWRGPASSPITFEDLIVVHMDGANVQYLAAMDKSSGEVRWVTFRSADYRDLGEDGRPAGDGDLRKAYNTALVIDFEGKQQLISPSAKAAYSYDPRTGKEIWQFRHGSHSSASRTLYRDGVAYINVGLDPTELWAVRVDGRGDVTDSHVVWKCRKGVPSRSSPVVVGDRIYMVSEKGIASCIDPGTGDCVWQERLGGRFSASVVSADGKIYFFSEEGVATVIRPGKEFDLLAKNRLNEGFMASPAIAGKALYLRTKTHLYRIEETK